MKKLILVILTIIVAVSLAAPPLCLAADQPAPVSPQDVQQALDERRIEQGETKDGGKYFYVGKRRKVGPFFGGQWVNFEFQALKGGKTANPAQLVFALETSGAGAHEMKKALVVRVGDQEWTLTPPLTEKSSAGSGGVMFKYSYSIPETLIQAMVAADKPVTLKWKYAFQSKWKDYEYPIEEKVVRDIRLLYLGCR